MKSLLKNIFSQLSGNSRTITGSNNEIVRNDIKEYYNLRYPNKPEVSATIKFNVAGVNHDGRKQTIKSIIANSTPSISPYLGIPDKLLIEHQTQVFEKYVDGTDLELKLVPEPDNPHDKNAIKVFCNGLDVGYVPANKCERVLKLLDQDYTIWWAAIGGTLKKYQHGKIQVIEDNDYGIQVKLYKTKTK